MGDQELDRLLDAGGPSFRKCAGSPRPLTRPSPTSARCLLSLHSPVRIISDPEPLAGSLTIL